MVAVLAFFAGPIGRWIVVAVLLVSTAIAAGWHERNVGWNERDVQAKQEITELNKGWVAAEAAGIAKAKADAEAQELVHQKALQAIILQREKDKQDAKAQHDKDVAAARSGALRLRLPTAGPSCPDVPGPPGSGNPAPASAELSPEVTGALFAIADDADALIPELNACWQIVADDRKTFSTTKGMP